MDDLIDAKLEAYFDRFRERTIGEDTYFENRYGKHRILYADYIASGRLYHPIEDRIQKEIAPFMANTHSYSSETGHRTTLAYTAARKIIKAHVKASPDDVLVTTGTGMTGSLARLLRIMSLPRKDENLNPLKIQERPVIFISHMEHHSHHVPWMELDADVVILPPGKNYLVDPKMLESALKGYEDRKLKIGAFTACSNVTGAITGYHDLAKIMHAHRGLCFVDFAASAPYVDIDMHPKDPGMKLDAIYFSPHKFLGGPGSCGVLVFDKKLYTSAMPENPGGGNVKWTNPYGGFNYHPSPEIREDGGTPGILQVMRAALAIRLKETMTIEKMEQRESELLQLFFSRVSSIKSFELIGDTSSKRIGSISFNLKGLHYNLVVRLLNDRFGIQARGGWSCASTFAQYYFALSKSDAELLCKRIDEGNFTGKPGWVRISLHPIMKDEEVCFIINALSEIESKGDDWGKEYRYNKNNNEFEPLGDRDKINLHGLFNLDTH